MKEKHLEKIINKIVQEYTGTGASGGNAGDGNSMTSPRPYPDDHTEVQKAYTDKNVYGAEGGHYSRYSTKSDYNNQKFVRFEELESFIKKIIKELNVEEEAYPHTTLTTQGQSIHRAPGVWEEDELQEQLSGDEMKSYNDKKVSYQKQIAKVDIEIAKAQKQAFNAQTQQQTQAIIPQLDNIDQQLYDINETIVSQKQQKLKKDKDLSNLNKSFEEIPVEDEEQRLATYEQISKVQEEISTLNKSIKSSQEQRQDIQTQKESLFAQRSSTNAASSKQGSEMDKNINKMRQDLNKIGSQTGGENSVAEILLKEYMEKRINTNLMEQMDSYKETTRGSLKKFFEMFKGGKTNEEVLQFFAQNKIQIPETYMTKAKKYFESYEKLKLELGFMEQEAKDFKKTIEPSQQEETKQLSTQLFKK
mgnify:CR=1 FL=1